MKLTKAQKKFVMHVRDQGGEINMWPIGLCSHVTVRRCCALGVVEKLAPPSGFGLSLYRITPAGRALLEGE